MERVCKFAKLDLFMIKPYIKRYLLILLLVAIPIIISTKNVYTISFMAIFYGVIMVSYPFVLSEKNHIENFYGTLSLNKQNIVNGRYIFALIIMTIFTIFACASIIIGSIIIKQSIQSDEIIFILSTGFFFGIILLSIQIPIYFKVGYTKGKVFTYIPFIATALLVPFIAKLSAGKIQIISKIGVFIENNAITSSIILILCGLLIFEISNIISQKLYSNK